MKQNTRYVIWLVFIQWACTPQNPPEESMVTHYRASSVVVDDGKAKPVERPLPKQDQTAAKPTPGPLPPPTPSPGLPPAQTIRNSGQILNPADKDFLRRMLAIADTIDSLYKRANGNDGAGLFGQKLWPEGFSKKDIDIVSRRIDASEILNPFTVVTAVANGGYQTQSFYTSNLLGADMKALVDHLGQAAEMPMIPPMKTYVMSRKEAFHADALNTSRHDAFLDSEAMLDWEVAIGLSSLYPTTSALPSKALFSMVIARENRALTEAMDTLVKQQAAIRSELQLLLEVETLALSPRGNILRFMDIWRMAGHANQGNRSIQLQFPIPQKPGKPRRMRSIFAANLSEQYWGQVLPALTPFLMRSSLSGETPRASAEWEARLALVREWVGSENQRILVGTTQTDLSQLFGDGTPAMIEVITEGVASWLLLVGPSHGWIPPADAQKLKTAQIARWLDCLRFPVGDPKQQMASVFLRHALKSEGLIMSTVGTSPALSVDRQKWDDAVLPLVKEIAAAWFFGDGKRATDLLRPSLKGAPEKATENTLQALRTGILAKLPEGTPKWIPFSFDISDLEASAPVQPVTAPTQASGAMPPPQGGSNVQPTAH